MRRPRYEGRRPPHDLPHRGRDGRLPAQRGRSPLVPGPGRGAPGRADGRVLLAGPLRVNPHGVRSREAGAGIQAVPGRRVSAVAPSPPVPLHTLVAEGDPAESLLLASQDADLLVLGTRGRSPFAGM